MPDKNGKLIEELDRLEKGAFTGQTVLHWLNGIARIIEFPKKPIRKEFHVNEKVGGTD